MRIPFETESDAPGADKPSGSLRRLLMGGARMRPTLKEAPERPGDSGDEVATAMAEEAGEDALRGEITVLPLVAPHHEDGRNLPARLAALSPPLGIGDRRDWSLTLSLVHRAVAAVRASEERAVKIEADAHEMAQRSENDRMLARARLISAEARAEEAEVRATEAEAYARAVEERAREIENDLQEARVRTKEAEARAHEAEAWLKRLHDALLDQVFSNQIEGIVREYSGPHAE